MELQLANKLQHEIATLMWNAENNNVVNEIIKCYGHDAVVVYNMMVAAVFDQIDDTDIAEDVVAKIKNQ